MARIILVTGGTRSGKSAFATDFPVDDWLHGIGRVREIMWHWENVTFLGKALSGVDLELRPAR